MKQNILYSLAALALVGGLSCPLAAMKRKLAEAKMVSAPDITVRVTNNTSKIVTIDSWPNGETIAKLNPHETKLIDITRYLYQLGDDIVSSKDIVAMSEDMTLYKDILRPYVQLNEIQVKGPNGLTRLKRSLGKNEKYLINIRLSGDELQESTLTLEDVSAKKPMS